MSLMDNMVALFRVDAQVRALRGRVDSARRYFDAQERQLAELSSRMAELKARRRQVAAAAGLLENEVATVDERIEKLRKELNTSASNKQYSAVLAEMTTIKENRRGLDEKLLAEMVQAEKLDGDIEALEGEVAERKGVRDVAKAQFDERRAEVAERLAELEVERSVKAAAVPPSELETFDELADMYDGEAMAILNEVDRRRREYACDACHVHVPFETLSQLLGGGSSLVRCSACGRILFLNDELRGAITTKR